MGSATAADRKGHQEVTGKGDTMKKLVLFALAALMGLALTLTVTGCGSSDAANEKLIREGLTEEFNQIKDPNSTLWKGMSDTLPPDVFASWIGSCEFEIVSVAINGDTADATISLTGKQLYPALESAQEKLMDEATSGLAPEEAEERLYELLSAELDKLQPATTEVVLTYKLEGKTWMPSNEAASSQQFQNALLGS
jgi:hypothetical protein